MKPQVCKATLTLFKERFIPLHYVYKLSMYLFIMKAYDVAGCGRKACKVQQ